MNTDGSHSHAIGYPLEEGKHTHPEPYYSGRVHHVHPPDPVAIIALALALFAFVRTFWH